MSASGTPALRSRRARVVAVLAVLLVAAGVTAAVWATRHHDASPAFGVDGVHAGPTAARHCQVTRLLVPTCGHWWGVAPLAHTDAPVIPAMRQEEQTAGRVLDIVHVYHTNSDLFPTSAERQLALSPGHHRLLLINWKPATDMSWRAVAHGHADGRIDRLAHYIKQTFRHRFFLTIWHEPENDVVTKPSRGMTARDYSAMFRHVVKRLRADGVAWAITVMDYMGFDNWAKQPWFGALWPGRRFVDWIGLDPYGSGARSGWTARDFATLVNRPDGSFPGFYAWARRVHPYKPLMLAEWGVAAAPGNPSGQAHFLHTVAQQLGHFPHIKALVYFDMPTPPPGQPRTYLRAAAQTVPAYRALVRSAALRGPAVPH
jgi:hypothetical protein